MMQKCAVESKQKNKLNSYKKCKRLSGELLSQDVESVTRKFVPVPTQRPNLRVGGDHLINGLTKGSDN